MSTGSWRTLLPAWRRGTPADSPGSAGGEAKPSRRGPRPFARPLWYPLAVASAVLALVAGGAMTLLTLSRGAQARPLADDCGLVTCGARLPAAVAGPAAPRTAVRGTQPAARRHRARHPAVLAPVVHQWARPLAPAAPHPHRRHRAHVPSGPGQPAALAVTVSYTLDSSDPWQQDVNARLTIVNTGSSPVAGWTARVSLPGDQVRWVGYPGSWDPFAGWRFTGGTLILTAVSGGETLAPGATEVVPIWAQGTTTVPASCQFNGSACQP